MKKIICLCVCLCMLFSLCACGGENNNNDTNSGKKNPTSSKDKKTDSIADSTNVELSQYLVKARETDGGLYGYIDIRTGEYAIEPAFTYCDESFGGDGWAKVEKDEEYIVINTDGKAMLKSGSYTSICEYEDDCIVAVFDEKTPKLYHGAEFVKELKLPVEDFESVSAGGWAFVGGNSNGEFYDPERYIVLKINLEDDVNYAWYDSDGKFIYLAKDSGGLAGDESGYYHINKSSVDKIDFEGNVVQSLKKGSSVPKVSFDGDNWYVPMESEVTGGRSGYYSLYTNGLTEVCNISDGSGYYRSVDAGDGIIRLLDGKYMKADGTYFYAVSMMNDSLFGFQNGYAKVENGAQGKYSGDFVGYIDTNGNEVLEIDEKFYDDYSSVLKDGYLVYGDGNKLGVMKIDGTIITEPKFQELYTRE